MTGAPGLVWEAGIEEEIKAGAEVTFVALGPEDESKDTVLGWFVILVLPDGKKKLLVKQVKYEPRLFKTYPGISAFAKQHCADWKSITLPLSPTVRSVKEAWELIDQADDRDLEGALG